MILSYVSAVAALPDWTLLCIILDYLQLSMAPLQGLSRRFWFANINDPDVELRRASTLHRTTLLAVAAGDEEAAVTASLALNDYLTEFTYKTLRTNVAL